MNAPLFSVRRPVFTTMVTLMVVLLGAVSLSRLQIDMLPAVERPRLTVSTSYEGASPEVMERLVTQILEEIVGAIPGVEELTSNSSEGRSDIRMTFAPGTDLDVAAQDIRARIEDEISELPDDVVRPRISKFDIASFPVVILGVASALDPVDLTELVETQLRYRFARLPGVAQVDAWGGYPREVRVELDPERLNALRLPLNDVLTAIRDANLDLPAGSLERGRYEVSLRAPAEFQTVDEIRRTVVALRDGAPVELDDVATVRDTYEKITRAVRINGERGVRVAIRKQSKANTVEVSKAILEEIERVNRDIPQIEVVPVSNQGNFIERSITNVTKSVLYGGLFAVLVLLLFLRNLRSTLVISVAIPISAIATFALIYMGGFTLNLMTLGGLALGVGMMVDSSIVVLENIVRRQKEEGESRWEAAVKGAGEVGGAIVASTTTTLVIFLPLVFVQGVTGALFQELAFVIVFSLCAALLVAMTVIPMLSSRVLRTDTELHGGKLSQRLGRAAGRLFDGLDTRYRNLVRRTLRHPTLVISGASTLLAGSLLLLPSIGTEFLPPSDEGEVRVETEMELGTRLGLVAQQTELVERAVVEHVPELRSVVLSASGGSSRTARGYVTASLVPAAARDRSNVEIADDLRALLEGEVPGTEIRTRAPQGQFLLQRLLGSDDGLNIEIRGYDLDVLESLAKQAAEVARQVPGITDVDVSREDGIPQEILVVDRDKAADLGLTVRDVAEAIETAVAGTRVGDYRAEGNSYRILVQLKDIDQVSLERVLDLTLSTPRGEDVALRNVVQTRSGRGPIVIDRKDQQRVVRVTCGVAGRPEGSVAADVQERLGEIARPVGYEMQVAGTYEEQQAAFNELVLSLLLALLLVYMVLACQYESLRDPLVVMLSVPFAIIGVLVILFATDTTLNVQSYIGCIMLGGIVVNNAILLVDQANRLGATMEPREAIAEAGRRRLRPILMTSLTTMLGLLPLALGLAEGSEAQAPLARAVVGGLLASTVISLLLIPAVYSITHGSKRRPDPAAGWLAETASTG